MSNKLMDTTPGGETPQYESIQTVTNPTDTQHGQFGDKNSLGVSEIDQQKQKRGEEIAENVRYGQNVSESGVGGMTTNSQGAASQEGYGGAAAQHGEDSASQTRQKQGYGEGSGVGA